MTAAIQNWHHILEHKALHLLSDALAEDVMFHSPVVWTPQKGKALTIMYLSGAAQVLGVDGSFHYTKEVIGERCAVLEFQTIVDGITVEGVDIISWNEADKITEFKVMLRPLKAVLVVKDKMAELMAKYNSST